MRHYRTELGDRFSEGARLLWVQLLEQGLSFRDLAGRLSKTADIPRWLYGDKLPPLWAILEFEKLFGIAPAMWLRKPKSKFVVPALRTGTDG